jgi:hypothetical protein
VWSFDAFVEEARSALTGPLIGTVLWRAYELAVRDLNARYGQSVNQKGFDRPQLLSAIITNFVVTPGSTTLDGQDVALAVGSLPVVTPAVHQRRRVRAPAVVVQLLADASGGACVTACGHLLTTKPSCADAFESVVASFWAAHLSCLAQLPGQTACMRDQLPSALLLNGAADVIIRGSLTPAVVQLLHRFPYTPQGYQRSQAVLVPEKNLKQVSADAAKVICDVTNGSHLLELPESSAFS